MIKYRLCALLASSLLVALASISHAAMGVVSLGDKNLNVQASPSVLVEQLDTEMGTLKSSNSVRTVPHKGDELSFEVPFDAGAKSLILEFQEIHNRRPDAYGYTVVINGRDVYFRTYQELGAGPNHFFVEVPEDLLKGGSPLKVTLRHEGGGAFSIARVWAWEDFFNTTAKSEQVFKPMGLLLPPDAIKIDGKPAKPKTEEEWVALFEEQKKRFAGLKDYSPVGTLGFGGSYGGRDPKDGNKSLLKGFRISGLTAMPGEMMLNGLGWFSGPTGPDGLGGYFSDIRYQKTSFNPQKGAWQASFPNIWGNTPAYTLRDPNMNAFLEKRFQQMMSGAPEELARLRLAGTPPQPILVREFAPSSGEITDEVVKSAAKDGVKLDPTDGMSLEERMWMHKDTLRTWQDYADSLRKAMGRDIAVVDRGKLVLPDEQSFDNFYAHPNFMTDDPAGDERYGGGQHGMVDGLWSSGEIGATSGHQDIGANTKFRDVAMYDYLPANGKFAAINLERTMLKENFEVLRLYYERGSQFLCLFNADDGDEKFVRGVDGIENDPASPPSHAQPVVTMEKIETPGSKGKTPFHREALYRLTSAGDPFPSGLTLDVDGRVSPGDANKIEVFLGDSPKDMKLVATLTEKELPDPDHWTPQMTSQYSMELGDAMIGKNETYLKFVFHAEGAEDAAFLISQNVKTRWPKQSGYLAKTNLTRKDTRTLQLWLQERSVCERLLRYYREAGGEDAIWKQAKALYDEGRYASARRLIGPAMSEILPARYLVRGHGKLGRYPVSVRLPGDDQSVFVTLENIGPDAVKFSLHSESDSSKVDLVFDDLDPKKSWALESSAGGGYRLIAGKPVDKRVSVKDGKVSVALDHINPPPAKPKLPSKLVARFLGQRGNTISFDLQDLELMDYGSNMSLPLVKGAPHTRSADGLENTELASAKSPKPHDEVTLDINDQGEVTAIHSRYGYDKGRIKKFHPPVVIGGASNGAIELENGKKYELVFEKGSAAGNFETVALQGGIISNELQSLASAFKPGDEVEIFYSPYAEKKGLPRIITVKQPRKLLLDVDYTKDPEWKKAAHSVKDVDVKPHRPEPNYLYKIEIPMMRPVKAFDPGTVVYHITNDKPLGTTAVEFAARAFDASSRVTFYTSPDGKKWTRVGQFDKTWQNSIPQNLGSLPYQFLDLTPQVEGLKSFYLKAELAMNSADHRYCLAKLRVATEDKQD
jgi:hypothetical protein